MDVYLLKVDPVANNNKFYMMHEDGNGFFTATYGRVGTAGSTARYPMRSWKTKYNEKIKKGYRDVTNLKGKADTNSQPTFEGPCADIMSELMKWANAEIQKNYTITPGEVTPAMINTAKTLINELSCIYVDDCNVKRFNDLLGELFITLPRKMNLVSNFLAKSAEEFPKIIQKELDLLDVMEAFVPKKSASSKPSEKTTNLFEIYGLEMEPATDEELSMIRSKVDSRTTGKVVRAWKITNKETQKAYNQYISDNNIKNTMLLWHGSGNENWLSIIKMGLKIRPSGARYTGSMFGDGIYFATKASKSFGYTSYHGTYWRNGNQSKAFMALFEVAAGNPYDVYQYTPEIGRMTYDKLRKEGDYHCTFAHEGSMLRNDEIVFYKPEQVTIKYLVEFN